jgi:YtcA family
VLDPVLGQGAPHQRQRLLRGSASMWLAEAGAPTFNLFGAFFPAWLLCVVLGIFVALGARIFFATRGLTEVVPLQLAVCTSLGAIFALLVWLLFFGR